MNKSSQHEGKRTVFNTVMLYMLAFAKIIFPLIVLPFLTRTLSIECYGAVAYVKSVMAYAQIIIDFGFNMSSVKDIVRAKDNESINYVVGDTIIARILLGVLSFAFITLLSLTVPILEDYTWLLFLSFLPSLLSAFLLDFFFRGIEKMHLVSIIFVLMKTVSTILTIVFVQDDSEVLLIPIIDIVGTIVAISISWFIFYRYGYEFKCDGVKSAFFRIKESCLYFTNSVISSVFGALNTVLIGICIEDIQQVAFWSVSMQLIGGIQTMYSPLVNGIYPYMIKRKKLSVIKKVLLVFVPLVVCGTILAGILSPKVLTVISGEKYCKASVIFVYLLPVLVFSFPVAILGWPTLGCIDKVKEINISTLSGAVVQITGLFFLYVCKQFDVFNIAILRNISEISMCLTLVYFTIKYRNLFNK